MHLSLSVHESVTHVPSPICRAARGLDSCGAGHQATKATSFVDLPLAGQAARFQKGFIHSRLEKWTEHESEAAAAAADGVDRRCSITRQINVLSIHMAIMC